MLTGGTSYFAGSHPDAVLDPARPSRTRAGREIYRGREVVEVDDYLTDVFSAEAAGFIDRHAGGEEPFFLVLAYNAPHTPLETTRAYMDTVAHVEDYRTRIYAAMVSSVDRGVGEVVDRLAAHGIADDTLIVFMSDNGCVGYADIQCSNGPLGGSKRFHLEGGIRIPFIMHWPGWRRHASTASRSSASICSPPSPVWPAPRSMTTWCVTGSTFCRISLAASPALPTTSSTGGPGRTTRAC